MNMSTNNTDRLPCTVECEHCGELLCSEPASTLCCTRAKAVSDGCTIPMWECAGCKADLDAQTEGELASVTHPAVRANILADRVRTTKLPVCSMADLVYGPRRRPVVSRQIAFRAALLGAVIGLFGCAGSPRPVAAEVETVGTLSASYHSVAVAPVHASTDLTPSFGAVDTDEDAPVTVTAPAEKVEAPEIAPKTDGVTVGGAR